MKMVKFSQDENGRMKLGQIWNLKRKNMRVGRVHFATMDFRFILNLESFQLRELKSNLRECKPLGFN